MTACKHTCVLSFTCKLLIEMQKRTMIQHFNFIDILHIDNKLIIDQAANLFSKEFPWKRSKSVYRFCLYF